MPDWMFQTLILLFLCLFATQIENIRLSIKQEFERRNPRAAVLRNNPKDEHA